MLGHVGVAPASCPVALEEGFTSPKLVRVQLVLSYGMVEAGKDSVFWCARKQETTVAIPFFVELEPPKRIVLLVIVNTSPRSSNSKYLFLFRTVLLTAIFSGKPLWYRARPSTLQGP